MKQLTLLLSITLALLLSSCRRWAYTMPSSVAVESYIEQRPTLPEIDKTHLRQGAFEVGLQESTVLFLLGEPNEIIMVQQPWAKQEKWVYKKGPVEFFYIENGVVAGMEWAPCEEK